MLDDLYTENLVDSPDEIEHVIEGGEDQVHYESGRESGNEDNKNEGEAKKDEDEKDKKEKKIRRKLGPRVVLNAERLNGPRGIGNIEQFFSDIKLRGKGREAEDLELVMKRLEHWTHRLAPRMQFDDCLKKIEKLGSKKEIANRVKRIRLGYDSDDIVRDDEEDNALGQAPDSPSANTADQAFDQLLASSIPAPPVSVEITSEQREQMLRNRLIAEERRAARIQKAQEMKQLFLEKQKVLSSLSQDIVPDQSTQNNENIHDEEREVNDGSDLPKFNVEKDSNFGKSALDNLNSVTNSQSKFEEEIEFRDEEFEANIAALEREINETSKNVIIVGKDDTMECINSETGKPDETEINDQSKDTEDPKNHYEELDSPSKEKINHVKNYNEDKHTLEEQTDDPINKAEEVKMDES